MRPIQLAAVLVAGGLVFSGCESNAKDEDSDVTYEITSLGQGAVRVRYLKETRPGDEPGKFRAAEGQQNTKPPFTVQVHLGDGWTHAWIEAKTEPVDRTIKLHCVLRHNGAVLTEGDGMGFVSCRAHSNGAPPPPPRPSA
ncbi:hypothetical protein [Segniliparus rugosus]|uniref:Lipoprotein n=1 Tax=Segniliparus rugosus (strain ATCC BAA-974 / DSM 45345 / CCUG 50838 / CIP 108380 / JCM 13579 / CDC 945) TaxID=679197 RepID=E5XR19_SEGRC|nr:hypothetical protein [Segniliparus rugosus]EFV13212.1 hypothetical protein HMPREF9336_01941 [Segniliparus rugosus ATCC BAA-974]